MNRAETDMVKGIYVILVRAMGYALIKRLFTPCVHNLKGLHQTFFA
jgi:hypothetical protein